jgi:hypothetical protein
MCGTHLFAGSVLGLRELESRVLHGRTHLGLCVHDLLEDLSELDGQGVRLDTRPFVSRLYKAQRDRTEHVTVMYPVHVPLATSVHHCAPNPKTDPYQPEETCAQSAQITTLS